MATKRPGCGANKAARKPGSLGPSSHGSCSAAHNQLIGVGLGTSLLCQARPQEVPHVSTNADPTASYSLYMIAAGRAYRSQGTGFVCVRSRSV